MANSRYSKYHSNYILSKPHQDLKDGSRIWVRDWVTIGGQHRIEKGKKPYYSDTNFLFTDNSFPTYQKKHQYGNWVGHLIYDDVKDASDDVNKVEVNMSSNDIRDFAYYGSAVELVKASVLNIINWFPATVTVSNEETDGEYTVNNPFDMDFVHTLSNEEKKKYNPDRYLRDSFQNYTLNGKDITGYEYIGRKFYKKEETGVRHVKSLYKTSTLKKIENVNVTFPAPSLKHYSVELIENTKLEIDDFNCVEERNEPLRVHISEYNRNDGSLNVNGTIYTATSSSAFLKDTSHSTSVERTLSGYGFKVLNNVVSFNGKDYTIRTNYGTQALNSVEFKKDYKYVIGPLTFTAESNYTTTPYYVTGDGQRMMNISVNGRNSQVPVSSYLNEYDENAVKADASFNITGVKEGADDDHIFDNLDDMIPIKWYFFRDNPTETITVEEFKALPDVVKTAYLPVYDENGREFSEINLLGGYEYVLGYYEDIQGIKKWLCPSDMTVTPICIVNEVGTRTITIRLTEDEEIHTGITLSEQGIPSLTTYTLHGTSSGEHTITFSPINVNNSISISNEALNNIYKFIIKLPNESTGRYIDIEKTIVTDSNTIYLNQINKKLVKEDGTVLLDLSSYPINSGSSFILSFLPKVTPNPNDVIENSFTIHPALELTLNGSFFVALDGLPYKTQFSSKREWQDKCYKTNDVSHSISYVTKIRYYNNRVQLIDRYNNIIADEFIFETTSDTHTVSFYTNDVSRPTYSYMQCFEDGHVPSGWTVLDCNPSTWLPTMEMKNGLDKYVKECDSCEGNDCYVMIPISGEDRNNPLYSLYLSSESETIEIGVYINEGELIYMSDSSGFVIQPKKELLDRYFESLEGFEKQLLTLESKPVYTNSFITPLKNPDEETYKYVLRDYTWPSTEVTYDDTTYNLIDVSSGTYENYISSLISIAEVFDELWCDNLYKNMTHEAIKNFDWTYTREYENGEEEDNIDGGNRMMKFLRVLGRGFDDIKRLADGIGFVSRNTYEGFDNQPEAEVSDRLDTMGWDITCTIPNFTEEKQGYINKNSQELINYDTYISLPSIERQEYLKAYVNRITGEIVGFTDVEYRDPHIKFYFKRYFPLLDLTNVVIDDEFLNTVDKQDGETVFGKWYNASNSTNVDVLKNDNDFMRKLLLSSDRIFNTKGTQHSIEMVMAMFGFGRVEKTDEENTEPSGDYELTETYYKIDASKLYGFDDEVEDSEYDMTYGELVTDINYYKDYPHEYDDIYTGVPLNDILIDGKRYIIPFFNPSRHYDGDLYFESRGGWGKNDDGEYIETISYLHVVENFSELLTLNPYSLNDGDIYYVNTFTDYADYVNDISLEDLSHYFYVKFEGKYNPELPESWENVDIFTPEEEIDADMLEMRKKANYLDNLLCINVGNNPHVGYGQYDDGNEFKEYMELPFKYAIENSLLTDKWKDAAEKITYEMIEEQGEKIKNMIEYPSNSNETEEKYCYYNRKMFIMTNKVDSELFKQYFKDAILPYVMQVIPSTTILVLDNFVSGEGSSNRYSSINLTLSYPDEQLSADGIVGTVRPTFTFRQVHYKEDGTTEIIDGDTSTAVLAYGGRIKFEIINPNVGDVVTELDGNITLLRKNDDASERRIQVKMTVTLNGKTNTTYANVYQAGKSISNVNDPYIINFRYGRLGDKFNADGTGTLPLNIVYSQSISYNNGDTEQVTTGGTLFFEITDGHENDRINNETGYFTYMEPNHTDADRTITIQVSVSLNGKTSVKTTTVKQSKRAINGYTDFTVKLTYPVKINYHGNVPSAPTISCSLYRTYDSGDMEKIVNPPIARNEFHGTNNDDYLDTETGVVNNVPVNSTPYERVIKRVLVTLTYTDEQRRSITTTNYPAAEVYQKGKTT